MDKEVKQHGGCRPGAGRKKIHKGHIILSRSRLNR